jgi:hypothetical protein
VDHRPGDRRADDDTFGRLVPELRRLAQAGAFDQQLPALREHLGVARHMLGIPEIDSRHRPSPSPGENSGQSVRFGSKFQ